MKSNSTQTITQQKREKQVNKEKNTLRPSAGTVTFLKLFARNYHVEPSMPEGLQGIILG